MKSNLPDLMILTELEDILEDRQTSDRRAKDAGRDPETLKDRRTGDRRDKAEKNDIDPLLN